MIQLNIISNDDSVKYYKYLWGKLIYKSINDPIYYRGNIFHLFII